MLRPKKTYAALSGKRSAATSTLNQSEVSGTASAYGSRLGQMRRCGRSAGTSKELGDEGKKGSGRRLLRRHGGIAQALFPAHGANPHRRRAATPARKRPGPDREV